MINFYPLHFSAQLRQHLRALRQQAGLTQAQLGSRIGVSQARIAEIEANPGLVNLDQILQVLSALDASLLIQDKATPPTSNFESLEELDTIAALTIDDTIARAAARTPIARKPVKDAAPALDAYMQKLTKAKKGSW